MTPSQVIALADQPRPTAIIDTECAPNYWSIAFLDAYGEKRKLLELYDGHPLDREALAGLLRKFRVVTFNGLHYDQWLIFYALKGATNAELKRLNDEIIVAKTKPWVIEKNFNLRAPAFWDHIDVMPVSPLIQSGLKKHMAHMHSRTIQELPFAPDEDMTPKQIEVARKYVFNDLYGTRELFIDMKGRIELRAQMSVRYGIDLRSKSDAQVAEAVIKHLVEKHKGDRIYKSDIRPGKLDYDMPAFIQYQSPEMKAFQQRVRDAQFRVRNDGYVETPSTLKGEDGKGIKIAFGRSTFTFGIGGLHSNESRAAHVDDDEWGIYDNDVRGYYPNEMIASRKFPKNMGPYFQELFIGFVREREVAKAAKNKPVAESMKIMCNGTFGKTGSPYSILYSPDMMLQTTITGQLSLLMLIEAFELNGFPVISANTDGVVAKVQHHRRGLFRALIFDWECATQLQTEETRYKALYSASVNDYFSIAIEEDGKPLDKPKIKRKGSYSKGGLGTASNEGLKKAPDAEICADAVVEFLANGVPIEETIRYCTDIRKFLRSEKVAGGCEKDGEYIGKQARWYHSVSSPGPLISCEGKKVGRSEGAQPCLTLPDELPDDLDLQWYEREAYARLYDLGVTYTNPIYAGRTDTGYGRLPDQKTWHLVDFSTGTAMCGAMTKDVREPWIENGKAVPEVGRVCTKCKKDQL